MKLVTNTQINGKALRIDEQVACPHCHAQFVVNTGKKATNNQ